AASVANRPGVCHRSLRSAQLRVADTLVSLSRPTYPGEYGSSRSLAKNACARKPASHDAVQDSRSCGVPHNHGHVKPFGVLAHFATELVLDVGADDVLEIRFRLEAERQRALSVNALVPSPDEPDHQLVGHALDARDGGRSCDAAEGRDLLADGAAAAGHREVDPVAELLARQRR